METKILTDEELAKYKTGVENIKIQEIVVNKNYNDSNITIIKNGQLKNKVNKEENKNEIN